MDLTQNEIIKLLKELLELTKVISTNVKRVADALEELNKA